MRHISCQVATLSLDETYDAPRVRQSYFSGDGLRLSPGLFVLPRGLGYAGGACAAPRTALRTCRALGRRRSPVAAFTLWRGPSALNLTCLATVAAVCLSDLTRRTAIRGWSPPLPGVHPTGQPQVVGLDRGARLRLCSTPSLSSRLFPHPLKSKGMQAT
jgi:hypothetical protein